MHENMLP